MSVCTLSKVRLHSPVPRRRGRVSGDKVAGIVQGQGVLGHKAVKDVPGCRTAGHRRKVIEVPHGYWLIKVWLGGNPWRRGDDLQAILATSMATLYASRCEALTFLNSLVPIPPFSARACNKTDPPPADSPEMVTRSRSPPNAAMFSWIHSSASL